MIERSVGRGGFNNHNDTLIIQCALNVARAQIGIKSIAIDGIVGPETIGAILAFQQGSQRLANDGRIDPGGRTMVALVTLIGGDEYVFGPIIQQLLAIKTEIEKLSLATPRQVKLPLSRLLPGLNAVSKYKDLAKILPDPRPTTTLAFNKGTPNFGFAGVDDATALLTLAAMALTMALLLVLIIQSPAFRKAVSVRAKELDRIMRELQINAVVGLKESVDIVNAIFNGSKEEEQRCRQSPTFEATPQCIQAMRDFSAALIKMQSLMPRLISLLNRIINYAKFPHSGLDIMKTRSDFNKLLADAQALAFELQISLSEMREKCKCPDLP